MGIATTIAFAGGTLTSNGTDVADDATIDIGGKTYTFKAAYSNTDGHVTKGASAAATLANLQAAINLGAGAGTLYAAAMTKNAYAYAPTVTATVLTLKSRTPGAIGNLIAIGTAPTNLTRSGALFTGGSGSIDTALDEIIDTEQLNASALSALDGIYLAAVGSV